MIKGQRMSIEEFKNITSHKRKSKYRNEKTEYNGVLYDSKKEAKYAQDLDLLVKGKQVEKWERQTPFTCVVNKKKICTYYADFKVWYTNGTIEVIDVKGVKTDVYKIKKKLVEALFNIKIIEV